MTFFLMTPTSFTRCCLSLLLLVTWLHPSNGFSSLTHHHRSPSCQPSTKSKPFLVWNTYDLRLKKYNSPLLSTTTPSSSPRTTVVVSLASSPSPPEDPNTNDEQPQPQQQEEDESSTNPLERFNAMLDTPILDANNRSNQGPLAEALKDFVRDDPQLAQITFSGVVVVLFLILVRIYNAIQYGGF